jgi:photosystem II stability/assembly factor-like uncharacterized protein
MKNFKFFFVFSLVAILSLVAMAQSQWVLQQANGLTNSVNPQVVFSVVDNNVCWGRNSTNTQFLRTTNGGDTWIVSIVTGATGLRSTGISAIDSNTAWIIMTDPSGVTSGGIFKTSDGGLNWVKQGSAFSGPGGYPDVINFFDSNNGVCVGNPRGGYWEIYTTTDGGAYWSRVPSVNIPAPLNGEVAIEQNQNKAVGNSFWFSTFNSSLYGTTDRGYTWTVARNIIGGGSGFGFAFKDSLNGLACTFVGGNKITRTSDGGLTWIPINPLPPGLTGLSAYYIAYAIGTNGSYVITSNNNIGGPSPAVPGSAFTLDNGTTWTYINNLQLGPAMFSSWNTGWSGGVNNSIYKWVSNVLPVELTLFTAQAQNQTVILNWVTATELNNNGFEIQRKVLESDFATVGFVKGEGTTTNQKEYSYVDRNLADGKYFYRLKQLDFNGEYEYSNTIEVDVRLLDNFKLEQNYPNPFNPTTTIGYVLQEKSSTRLTVMNAIGEEIAVLVNEEQDKGYHRAELDGKNLSSGIYFYRLQAEDFVETKKMILLK